MGSNKLIPFFVSKQASSAEAPDFDGSATRVGTHFRYDVKEDRPVALGWDGEYLYMGGNRQNRLYELDRSTGGGLAISGDLTTFGINWEYELDQVGTTFIARSGRQNGYLWDGSTLYMQSATPNLPIPDGQFFPDLTYRWYSLNTTTGEATEIAQLTDHVPRAMWWDGTTAWGIGSTSRTAGDGAGFDLDLYKFNPKTGKRTSSFQRMSLTGYPTWWATRPFGAAYDGTNVWVRLGAGSDWNRPIGGGRTSPEAYTLYEDALHKLDVTNGALTRVNSWDFYGHVWGHGTLAYGVDTRSPGGGDHSRGMAWDGENMYINYGATLFTLNRARPKPPLPSLPAPAETRTTRLLSLTRLTRPPFGPHNKQWMIQRQTYAGNTQDTLVLPGGDYRRTYRNGYSLRLVIDDVLYDMGNIIFTRFIEASVHAPARTVVITSKNPFNIPSGSLLFGETLKTYPARQ